MQSKLSCDFTKCCFFINLRKGCLLIGYFYLIELIVSFVFMGINEAATIEKIQANQRLHHMLPLTIAITSIVCIYSVLAFVFAIILLIGLHKNKPEYVKAYLIFKIVFLVIYANLFIHTIFTERVGPIITVIRIVQLTISIYFLLVIRSYHMNVMKQDTHQIV